MAEILSETESVCPECLKRIPALRILRGEDVTLEKDCPEHGHFSAVIWRGEPAYTTWVRPKTPSYPKESDNRNQTGLPV